MIAGVQVIGAGPIEAKLSAIGLRALNPSIGLARAIPKLEEAEASRFAAFRGKYVRTGALKASLTGPGTGAIRRLTADTLSFGSALPYAQFHPTVARGTVDLEAIGRSLMAYLMFGGMA